MTIAALRRLLDEIDTQGGPEAAREWRLRFPDTPERPDPMTQPVPQFTDIPDPASLLSAAEPPALPVGKLLAWGERHDDPEVQDQAARARLLLTALRRRHAADAELAAIADETEQLEQRLAELRAREAELAPAKAKKKPQRDYEPAVVRAWAKAKGIECPGIGRVPKAIVDAWRAAQQIDGQG